MKNAHHKVNQRLNLSLSLVILTSLLNPTANANPVFSAAEVAAANNVTVPYDSQLDDVTAKMVNAVAFNYDSPNLKGDLNETCLIIRKMPGGVYHLGDKVRKITGDLEKELDYCRINFYDENTAICPKYWSTSPGTIIYNLSKTSYAGKKAEFEETMCRNKDVDVAVPKLKKIAKFKTTMNQQKTSGTFSNSSFMYYHFSRYLEADAYVPVAVYRSMDRLTHLERISKPGLKLSIEKQGKGSSPMNKAAYEVLVAAEQDPSKYQPTSELFTSKQDKVYGVILRDKGERYSEVFNGTRASGWGIGQNLDFMKTVPFSILRTPGELSKAMQAGAVEANKDAKIAKATGNQVPGLQVLYWMKEITDITILDYIFSQQDRIGNIDYRWYWYWLQEGKMVWQKAKTKSQRTAVNVDKEKSGDTKDIFVVDETKPESIPADAVLIQRTQLNDNDAGGRVEYANFTKKAEMINSFRHLSPVTYKKMIDLDRDFKGQGKLFHYVQDNFRLSPRNFQQIVNNVGQVADILRKNCNAGQLSFDLNPESTFEGGGVYLSYTASADLCESGEVKQGQVSTGQIKVGY